MSEPRSTVRALTCPNCGGTIALRAAGSTVSLVCEHCGSTLDATRHDLAVIVRAHEVGGRPDIPLGTRGALGGTTWEVTGYLFRDDGEAGWSEYLLFNPYEGYAFLIDDGRRFSLGRLMDRLPGHRHLSLDLDGETYQRFGERYDAWVRFVVGEFYWRVKVGEQARVTDFVRPGTMLSCEEVKGERTWTRTTLLDRGVAERAFGLPRRPLDPAGTPAPHEPSPYRARLWEAIIVGAVTALLLIVVAVMGSGTTRVAASDLTVTPDQPRTTRVIGPIDLPDRSSAVRVAASAPGLDNGWVDIDYSLVDRRTQASVDAYALAESYRGRDSDGPWREGNERPAIDLSSVPAGRYDLVVEATAHRWLSAQDLSGDVAPIRIEITVDRGGVFGGNLVLALLLILLWPGLMLFRHLSFESRRMAPTL